MSMFCWLGTNRIKIPRRPLRSTSRSRVLSRTTRRRRVTRTTLPRTWIWTVRPVLLSALFQGIVS